MHKPRSPSTDTMIPDNLPLFGNNLLLFSNNMPLFSNNMPLSGKTVKSPNMAYGYRHLLEPAPVTLSSSSASWSF